MSLKVLTYNIRHARGNDGRVDLPRIAEVVRDSGADLVALQEVYDWPYPRSYRQARLLPAMLGMDAVLQVNVSRGLVRQGNMMFSRSSLEVAFDEQLPRRGEHRGLMGAHLQHAGRQITFANTHLGLLTEERKRQRAAITRLINPDQPLILAGDFNSPVAHLAEIIGLQPVFTTGFSYSSKKPSKLIDNILISAHWTVVKTQILKTEASDHLPLLATLELYKV